MSFRLKTILGVAVIEALLLSILVISGIHYLQSSNEAQLVDRAKTSVRLISTLISDAVVASDLATLDVLVTQALKNSGLDYVRVRAGSGAVLAEDGSSEALAAAFQEDPDIHAGKVDGRFDVSHPVEVAGHLFGTVEIGYSTAELSGLVTHALQWMASVALTEMALVAVLGWILGSYLVAQLETLRASAKRVAEGDFGLKVPIIGHDELADTAASFNQMSDALARFAEEQRQAREQAEQRTREAETVLGDAVSSMSDAVVISDAGGDVVLANEAFWRNHPELSEAQETGLTLERMIGAVEGRTGVDLQNRLAALAQTSGSRRERELADGRRLLVGHRRTGIGGFVFVETDITDLHEAQERTRALELELLHAQKMESLGTLAAGIAHEINTPIQFIGDNLRFLKDVIDETLANDRAREHLTEDLAEEAPGAISDSLDGVKRVREIVASMRAFAHPDVEGLQPNDLNEAIRVTRNVCQNYWKFHAELTLELDPDLPPVPSRVGEINQVILNLITNASDAVEERYKGAKLGHITISSGVAGPEMYIAVADDGAGIEPDALNRVFDMFYTSKPTGKGTGQGLAICQAIVAGHDGRITVDSTPGIGTTFKVWLPLSAKAESDEPASGSAQNA